MGGGVSAKDGDSLHARCGVGAHIRDPGGRAGLIAVAGPPRSVKFPLGNDSGTPVRYVQFGASLIVAVSAILA
jgi:hypothetical protein